MSENCWTISRFSADDNHHGGDEGNDGNAFANYFYLCNEKKKFHETHLN